MEIDCLLKYYQDRYEKGMALNIGPNNQYYRTFREIELRFLALQAITVQCLFLKTNFLTGKAMKTKLYNDIFKMVEELLVDDNLKICLRGKKLPEDYFTDAINKIEIFKSSLKDKSIGNEEKYSAFFNAVQAQICAWIQIREDCYLRTYRKGKLSELVA